MKPHSLSTVTVSNSKTPAQKAAERGWAGRHGYNWPKGAKLPDTQVPALPRVKVADLPDGFIPPKYYEKGLEHNQTIASCCRHPENHEISARKTHPDEQASDIYIFHCKCGKSHVHWLVGMTDDVPRPMWEAS